MTTLFGSSWTDNKQSEQNRKMTDGPVPEVAAHSYEGAPSVERSSESIYKSLFFPVGPVLTLRHQRIRSA